MENWAIFFAAQVGASAALAGLIFVSVSLSLTKIIATANLPMRAFQALVILLEILVVSSLAIVPQSVQAFGDEVLAIGVPIWLLVLVFDRRTMAAAPVASRIRSISRMALSQVAALLFVAAGIAVAIGGVGGVHWLVPAIICSYLVAMTDAWVLLIEINR
jgi:modulator of FtsH protease